MTTAIDVARWIIDRSQASGAHDMTNMKLNKLVYFAQAHHLATTGRPLYADAIEAWQHGPVVQDVYQSFKSFGPRPITDSAIKPELDSVATELLEAVWSKYGSKTAGNLRMMSHDDLPYKLHYTGEWNSVIPVEEIRDYYHRAISEREVIVLSEVDFVDEHDEAELERADNPESVARAVAYLLA